MKKIFLLTIVMLSGIFSAQVGINTPSPVNTLDINGDYNARKEIRVAGTNTEKGSAGAAGTIFHNNADLGTNDWKMIKVADGLTSMSLFSMNTVADKTGVSFSGSNGSTSPYALNAALGSGWTVLPDAVDVFSVTKSINKVVFTFQTTVQKTANNNGSTSFACGIFVDDKLKAVRTDVILGGDGTNKIFNLNATLTNLPVKNDYSVKAACIKRNLNSGTIGLGRAVNTTYLNSDMAQSILTTSVLQPY